MKKEIILPSSIAIQIFLGLYFSQILLTRCFELDAPCDDTSLYPNSSQDLITNENDDHLVESLFGHDKQVFWIVTENGLSYCEDDCLGVKSVEKRNIESKSVNSSDNYKSRKKSNKLSCQPFVNKTEYDFLLGVFSRQRLKAFPEPDLIQIFDKTGELKLADLRHQLSQTKERNSVKTLNRLANFNRIIGDGPNAIECFRKALSLEPHNSDVLINLARVLFKLKFYDDAVYLTRKSIEYIRSQRSPWFQHFTLAEIYHSTGHDHQALAHVRIALKLKPTHANSMRLATELASKTFIESSRFISVFRLFEKIFTFLTSSAPSFYLQLFFHLFILVFLVLFGLIYSLVTVIYEFRGPHVGGKTDKLLDLTRSKFQISFLASQTRSSKKTTKLRFRIQKSVAVNPFKTH